MYRYMSAGEETPSVKKIVQNEYISKSDLKYRKIYLKACNPPENIVRGTEGLYNMFSEIPHFPFYAFIQGC